MTRAVKKLKMGEQPGSDKRGRIFNKLLQGENKMSLKKPVSWLNMQWIRLLKNEPFMLYYKETLNEDFPFSALCLKSAKPGRPVSLGRIAMENLYHGPRPVTKEKKRDMLDLLPYIPPINHAYFQGLTTAEATVDDAGLLDVVDTERD